MTRALAAVAVLASAAVHAEPSVREFSVDNRTEIDTVNRESCADDVAKQVRLEVDGLALTQYDVRFVRYPESAPNAPCPTRRDDPDILSVDESTGNEASSFFVQMPSPNGHLNEAFTKKIANLVGADCTSTDGGRENINYCAQIFAQRTDLEAVITAEVNVNYDTSAPPKPKIKDITPGDGSVVVDVEEVDTGAESYTTVVQYRACEGGDGGSAAEASECGATGDFSEADSDTFTVEIGSLKNSSDIELRALFEDDFGNRSEPTGLHVVSPESTLGPLSLYDGGENPVSCEASCADLKSSSASAAALLFVLSRRGRRLLGKLRTVARRGLSLAALAIVAFGALGSGAARADFGQMTISLGVSPYKPDIDSEYAAHSKKHIFPIYDCFYGGANLVEIGGDIDTHLWDGFGSLQLTTGLSLSQAQGFAQPTSALSTGKCGKATDTAVQLSFMKIRPGLTYRFDPFLDWFSFPLVPYARVGLIGAGYAFTKDSDFDQGGQNPIGMRFGVEGALGLMVALDFLDSLDPFVPDTTRRARANGVFDHTFFFAEGSAQDITSFRRPGLVLTPVDDFVGTGWPVLWKLGVAVELL